jgi:hypothetical protein
MKPRPETERLLDDLLAGDEAGFRDSLFRETLRAARRRRRIRQLARATPVLLALIAGLMLVRWRSAPPPGSTPVAAAKTYVLITSRPLPSSALVVTKPLAANEMVLPMASVQIIRTVDARESLPEIDDAKLLSLLGATPAALVRRGDHKAELVFVNASDERRLLRN